MSNGVAECPICLSSTCIDPVQMNQYPIIKNMFPEKHDLCAHTFCTSCMGDWLVHCLTYKLDLSCPSCRSVYISNERLYHSFLLSQCFQERMSVLKQHPTTVE